MGFRDSLQGLSTISRQKGSLNADDEKVPNVLITPNDTQSSEKDSEIEVSIAENPFADPDVAAYYIEEYEKSKYECRHHVDPSFTWTKDEERKVTWKTDLHVVGWAFIMFVALDIDRSNINAVTGSKKFFSDVNITTDQFNLGQTWFYLAFLVAELPSQLISKWIGADRFIPIQLTLWSVCAICQTRMKSVGSFYTLRVLVGLLEGGFIPDTSLWISYFYTNKQFAVRSGWFYLANPLTQVFSTLLAAAIFNLDRKGGWSGWQYVFLIEGLITLVVGLVAFFLMPPSVVQTRTWFRPNGWFSEREEKIVVNRVLRDDPSKGGMNNRQAVGPKLLWKALKDYDLWPIYAIRLICDSGTGTLNTYFSIIFQGVFSVITIDLLRVPAPALTCFTQLLECYLIGHFQQYAWVALAIPLWYIPFLAAFRWWDGFISDKWTTFGLLFLCLCWFTTPPALSAWCSHNSNSLRTRTVSLALCNIAGQLGTIVSSNLFRKDDKPRYKRGLTQMFCINLGAIALILLTRLYFLARNRWRDNIWNQMSEDEKKEYKLTTTDEGNKRLDFRFVL